MNNIIIRSSLRTNEKENSYKGIPTVFANVREAIHPDSHFERNKVKPRNLIDKEISPLVLLGRDDMQTSKRFSAFTLAEILLTLIIVGILAATVIPSLVNSTIDSEYKVAWKKTFSSITQTANLLINENGGSFANMCDTADLTCLNNKFGKHLNVSKICLHNPSYSCMRPPNYLKGGVDTEGAYVNYMKTGTILFYLTDSSKILLSWHSGSCSFTTNANECGWMMVDVNGDKGPNTYGKDFYLITVKRNRILPYGAAGSAILNTNDCNNNDKGRSCGALYLSQ